MGVLLCGYAQIDGQTRSIPDMVSTMLVNESRTELTAAASVGTETLLCFSFSSSCVVKEGLSIETEGTMSSRVSSRGVLGGRAVRLLIIGVSATVETFSEMAASVPILSFPCEDTLSGWSGLRRRLERVARGVTFRADGLGVLGAVVFFDVFLRFGGIVGDTRCE